VHIHITTTSCTPPQRAYWFYCDFYRDDEARNANLPPFNRQQFAYEMFVRCPVLNPYLPRFAELDKGG
jgi:hypothetical protein